MLFDLLLYVKDFHGDRIFYRIYDRHGNLLHTTRGRTARRRLINLSDIPNHVKLAFTSIEDQRFFSHFGIDFRRILGALIIDLRMRRL